MTDTLGDRMKLYEHVTRSYVSPRTYTIIRLDGCHFHTYTRGLEKPFDGLLNAAFVEAATELSQEIQGVKFAYHQSDEVSLLLTDFDSLNTTAWFAGNIQKIASVSASILTQAFNRIRKEQGFETPAYFDARVFTLPNKTEVMNYFLWRIQDSARNSLSGLAQSLYSQKQLNGAKKDKLKELCLAKGQDWDQLDPVFRYGSLIFRDAYAAAPAPDQKALLLPFIPNAADQPQDNSGSV